MKFFIGKVNNDAIVHNAILAEIMMTTMIGMIKIKKLGVKHYG